MEITVYRKKGGYLVVVRYNAGVEVSGLYAVTHHQKRGPSCGPGRLGVSGLFEIARTEAHA